MACVTALPGDAFEKCAKSCTNDPGEQLRINTWKLKDTGADKCSFLCMFKAINVVKENGDFNRELFDQVVKAKGAVIDYVPLIVQNTNAAGFWESFKNFLNTNRLSLAKMLNHEEAI